jgi:hypothetical protein
LLVFYGCVMKLNVTYQGGDKDGKSDVRETPEFPIELPGGRYVLTFRHALRESGTTEALATWVPHEDSQN